VPDLDLPDGRRLAYTLTGDPAGAPVIALHGTPGSARQLAVLAGPARDRGLALFLPDRAGYGGSSLPPDRLLTRTARRSEAGARALFAAAVRTGRTRPDAALDRFAALLAEPDARLLREHPDVRAAFLDDLRHPAPTTARDFRLFARPWDIDLACLAVPAHIWPGTEDRNVPVAHARVIAARCPAAHRRRRRAHAAQPPGPDHRQRDRRELGRSGARVVRAHGPGPRRAARARSGRAGPRSGHAAAGADARPRRPAAGGPRRP